MKHPILLRLAGFGFSTSVFFLAITAATVSVFGTPTALKSTLDKSGVYDSTVKQIAEEATDAATTNNDLGVSADTVKRAATDSFSATAVQTDIEKTIDSTYAWLDGSTERPNITLDLTPYVSRFTQSVGDQAAQRAKGLPPCTLEEVKKLDPNNINLSTISCLPPGVSPTSVQSAVVDKLVGSNEFLKDPVLTTDSLPKDAEGKTAIDRAHNVPTAFQWSLRAPRIFAGLALVCVVITIALTYRINEWRPAVRRLAKALPTVGIFLGITAVVTRLLFSHFTKPDGLVTKLAGGDFKDAIIAFMNSLQLLYTDKLIAFAAIYLIIGVLVLVAMRFIKSTPESGTPSAGPPDLPGTPSKTPITIQTGRGEL